MMTYLRGMYYMPQALSLLTTKGLKRFIILPLASNILFFVGLFYFFQHYLMLAINHYVSQLPSWLSFLSGFIYVLLLLSFIFIFYSFFTVFFNLLAAPFHGFLAEKAQLIFIQKVPPSIPIHQLIVRTCKRQWQFLVYFLPRFLLLVLLFFIPVLHVVYPLLWFLFTAWMLGIQYQDFVMDTNQISFKEMRRLIGERKALSLGFGTAINLFSLIPFVNFLIFPAAVIGGVLLFWQEYPQTENNSAMP